MNQSRISLKMTSLALIYRVLNKISPSQVLSLILGLLRVPPNNSNSNNHRHHHLTLHLAITILNNSLNNNNLNSNYKH